MSTEDVERYEAEVELQLYKEYKDVIPMFTYVVETERRFYLANFVDQRVVDEDGRSPSAGRGGRGPGRGVVRRPWVRGGRAQLAVPGR